MSLRTGVIVVLVAVLVFALIAWKRSTAPETPPAPSASIEAPDTTSTGMASMPQITPPEPADPGVGWDRPKRWMNEIAGSMRYATYIVPGAAADQGAECAVYYFGPGKGGGVDANLERWIGEFQDLAQHDVTSHEVRGMKISQVIASGTYVAHGMQGEQETSHPAWTLLGAIVEGPRGDLFFKLTGPSATVGAARKEFDSMLGTLKKK